MNERYGPWLPRKFWYVVRTASNRTIELADDAANNHNVPAWTPRVWVMHRLPRKHKRVPRLIPLTPTFVFVPEEYLNELLQLLDTHLYYGKIGKLAGSPMKVLDSHLDELRKQDRPERPLENIPKTVPIWPEGTIVLADNPFSEENEQIEGVIERGPDPKGSYRVLFKNLFPGSVQIPYFLLVAKTPYRS